MKALSGLALLVEREGERLIAGKGNRVVYNTGIFLDRGDEVLLNDIQAKQVPKRLLQSDDYSAPISLPPGHIFVG